MTTPSTDGAGRRPRPQFSIHGLLLLTAFVAGCCAAMRYASPVWFAVMVGTTTVILTESVLQAIRSQTWWRAFRRGFAIVGWCYFALFMSYWSAEDRVIRAPDLWSMEVLPTTVLTLRFYHRVFPITGGPRAYERVEPDGTIMNIFEMDRQLDFSGPYPDDFRRVAHCIWTLVLAMIGGFLSLLLYWVDLKVN